MRPTERCGGRGQAPGTAGQTRESIASVADHVGAGKQAAKTLHRRHLDESQRGLVFGRLAKFQKGANQHTQICAPTQAQLAEMLNVSRPTESAQICAVTQTQAALTRLGEMIEAAKNAKRIREGRPKKNGSDLEPFPERETLADLGIDKKVAR